MDLKFIERNIYGISYLWQSISNIRNQLSNINSFLIPENSTNIYFEMSCLIFENEF